MLKIIYLLSCVGAGIQLGGWFYERIREDLDTEYTNEANLGTLIAYIGLAMFPIVNTFFTLLLLQRVPLVWQRRNQ